MWWCNRSSCRLSKKKDLKKLKILTFSIIGVNNLFLDFEALVEVNSCPVCHVIYSISHHLPFFFYHLLGCGEAEEVKPPAGLSPGCRGPCRPGGCRLWFLLWDPTEQSHHVLPDVFGVVLSSSPGASPQCSGVEEAPAGLSYNPTAGKDVYEAQQADGGLLSDGQAAYLLSVHWRWTQGPHNEFCLSAEGWNWGRNQIY